MSDKKLKGEAYAEFDSNTGVLRIFRDDAGKYTNGQEDGAKIYFTGIEDITERTRPKWYDKKYSVTKVVIEDVFKPKTAYYMFCSMYKLAEIEGMENLDTSECTNMHVMFSNCKNLIELDLSNFVTSNVRDMDFMFSFCSSLSELDLSNFDTSEVRSMGGMFMNCSELTELDVSHFDTSKVTDMSLMFSNCKNLTSLDLSNFNTSNVTYMYYMFDHCIGLTELDLSNFDLYRINGVGSLVYGCDNIETIYVSDETIEEKDFESYNLKSDKDLELNSLYNVISDIQNRNTEDSSGDIENEKDEVWK